MLVLDRQESDSKPCRFPVGVSDNINGTNQTDAPDSGAIRIEVGFAERRTTDKVWAT
jgi:hypothetical protein